MPEIRSFAHTILVRKLTPVRRYRVFFAILLAGILVLRTVVMIFNGEVTLLESLPIVSFELLFLLAATFTSNSILPYAVLLTSIIAHVFAIAYIFLNFSKSDDPLWIGISMIGLAFLSIQLLILLARAFKSTSLAASPSATTPSASSMEHIWQSRK
jgi:hypothetical protein